MKIGLYATGSANSSCADLLDQVQYADEVGFDSAWLRERHFHPDHQGRNFFTSPFVAAAFLAARTRRLRLGIGARILPLDHPLHIAEDAATVDVISGGRLDLGVARIGENDLYQRAFGITGEECRGRFEESLDIIRLAWTRERLAFDGAYYKIPEVSVHPRPVQTPHPPIHLVGISPETLAFGAARGMPLLIAGAQTVPVVRQTQQTYDRLLRDAGHDPKSVVHPVNRFVYVAETTAQAVEDTRQTVLGFIHRPGSVIRDFLMLPPEAITYDLLFQEVCIFGDPDFCLRRLEALREQVDLRHVVFTFNYFTIDHAKCRRSMDLFVRHVLPVLRAGTSGRD
jgi:alkanesulfonate monooxygenase SsuD/methylene tetrahydromethanopterin reductase-like flavin-dependent oxidoreductase (luciferase family)